MKLGLLVCWALACWLSKVDCQSYNIKSRSDCCGSYAAYGPLYADWAYYKPHAQNEFAADFNSATKCKREHVQYIKITDMVEKNKALSPCMCTSAATECHESASAATTKTTTTQAPAQAGVTTTTTATTTTKATTTTTTAATTTPAPCDTKDKTRAKKDCCHLPADNNIQNVPIAYTDEEKKGNCCMKDNKCYCNMKKADAKCEGCPSILDESTSTPSIDADHKGCCGFKSNNLYLMQQQELLGECCRVNSPPHLSPVNPTELLGECKCLADKCGQDEDRARKLCPVPLKKTSRIFSGAATSTLADEKLSACKGAVRIMATGDEFTICNGVLADLPGQFPGNLPSVLVLKSCIRRFKSDEEWRNAEILVGFLGTTVVNEKFKDVFIQEPNGTAVEGAESLVALVPKKGFFDALSTDKDCPACVFNEAAMKEHMDDQKCLIVSWGDRIKPATTDALTDAPQFTAVIRKTPSDCQDDANIDMPEGSDCWLTTDATQRACTGDQGAPVLCELTPTKEYVLVGVVNAIDSTCTSKLFSTAKVATKTK